MRKLAILPATVLSVALVSCTGSQSGAPVLTAEMPLLLEEHLDVATIVGSEVSEDERGTSIVWDFSEPQLNGLGYALMQHDKLDAAVAILELNVEMFPDAPNTYDSLADAYLKQGDHERATRNGRRALELAPDHTAAMSDLAALLRHRGELEEARRLWTRVLSLNSSDAMAARNLQQLTAEMSQ